MFYDLPAITYTTTTTTTSSTHYGSGFFLTVGLIVLILFVISVVAFWKLFQKAGRPGWAAIVPVYNAWVLFEISGKPGWWALSILLSGIPFVGWVVYFVLYVIAMLELGKRFGKSTTFTVFGLIIFSFIGLLILGFGKDKYNPNPDGAAGVNPNPPVAQPPSPQTPPSSLPPVQPPQA